MKIKTQKWILIIVLLFSFIIFLLSIFSEKIFLSFLLPKRTPSPTPSSTFSPLPTSTPILSSPSPSFSPIAIKVNLSKRLIQPGDISLEELKITPKIPPYNLPLSLKEISNWNEFSQKINLSSQALSLLLKNGFVVIKTPKDIAEKKVYLSSREAFPKDDFVAYYKELEARDLPIFITTDSLLHYYHIFFDTTLLRLEKDLFYDDLWQISKELFEDSLNVYHQSSGDLKEAAKRNVAYFSVALELLKPKPDQIATLERIKKELNCEATEELCDKFYREQLKKGKFFNLFSPEEAQKYNFEIPDFVKDLVQKELELIEKHEGWKFSPIFIYKEDYSQYIPRGHYTKSEKLKNYFKAMMWYGRMTALIKGSDLIPEGKSLRKIQEEGSLIGIDDTKGLISSRDAKIQTLQASLIADKFSQSKSIQEKWQRIYAITSFFVGFSDDLGPYEYAEVLKNLFKEKISFQDLEKKYPEIRDRLLTLPYNPKIYSGLDACQMVMPCPPLTEKEIQELKTQAKKLLEATKGFRLMGQRFTLDSWLFSEIVSPYSGEYTGKKLPLPTKEAPFTFSWDDPYPEYRKNRPFSWVKTNVSGCPEGREVRGFPRGLDIMALFGSKRAKEILKELGDTNYSDYEKKFSELKAKIDSLPQEEWFKNLYWNWLYVLKSLLKEFGKGYQTFMQTKAWQDKTLTTALASWAELRHDTILYVKQSYTMAELGGKIEPVVGYVEPVPEFYYRLLNLTKLTKIGLERLIPQKEMQKLNVKEALDNFETLLKRLLEISKKELENKPLSEDDYYFIEDFGDASESLISSLFSGDVKGAQPNVDSKILKSVMIADVHTEGNTEKVLEEGVGFIKTLVVAYKLPQGNIVVGVGPVFSYYEFKQPMSKRLTDEEWREMLESGNFPPEPEWTKNFSE